METISTASAFLIYEKKVLLLLRDDKPGLASPNTWCLIGGFVDPGETAEEGVYREILEEVSIRPGNLTYIGVREYADGKTSSNFFSQLTLEEVSALRKGDEGQELKFFSFSELSGIQLSGSVRKYYTAYPDELQAIIDDGILPKPEDAGLQP